MSTGQTLRQMPREWLIALLSYALVVAPFGCQFQLDLFGGGSGATDLNTKSAGLFLNQDADSSLIVAGRSSGGDEFFVYGTRQTSGAVGEVSAILIRTSDGKQSFILLESGRPVHLQAADGSYAHVSYREVSAERLAATVQVHDAATGAAESQDVTVDLKLTAAQVAETIRQVTGLTIELPVVPAGDTGKWPERSLGPLLTALVVIPMMLLTELMIVIMGQVMAAVFAAVSAAFQAVVLVAFAPLFLFAGLLDEVTVRVEAVPLVDIFVDIPSPPQIEITIR